MWTMFPINQKICLVTYILLLSKIETLAQTNSFEIDSTKFDTRLVTLLNTIYQDDQSTRTNLLALVKNKVPVQEIDSIKNVIREKDKQILFKVDSILKKTAGWDHKKLA